MGRSKIYEQLALTDKGQDKKEKRMFFLCKLLEHNLKTQKKGVFISYFFQLFYVYNLLIFIRPN